ncbi:MAG: hypothetical protein LBV04_07160 [Deferribacteraceae bacterium]|jgi:[citrate (pro-3S)-lyase] ligase|nr:hypothetical protein [Deferribacteraceae bacterium]
MTISEIHPNDARCQRKFDTLLANEGIRRDPNLEYIIGIFDNDYNLLAAGACFANTLRCLAVDSAHRCEGLMEKVVTALVDYQFANGRSQLFIYTKLANADIFSSLGFYEVAHVENVILMENRKNGLDSFLKALDRSFLAPTGRGQDYQQTSEATECCRRVPQCGFATEDKAPCAELGAGRADGAAIVMNCNPFTLGHRFLVERAASENDIVHLFVVSEDLSYFPFADRYELVRLGCADLANVQLHQTSSYMISAAVFPSYFLQDESAAVTVQAKLDSTIFLKIAKQLGITRRYLGSEPFSKTTNTYNAILQETLPLGGVDCLIIERKMQGDSVISASRVRELLREGQIERVAELVPKTTLDYLIKESYF